MLLKYGAASLVAVGACALAPAVAAQEQTQPPIAVPPVIAPPHVMPSAPPRPGVITPPRWLRQPMTEFPERAQSRGIESGRARLECIVSVESRLTECIVLLETPEGAGFAQAALAGVASARVAPRTVNGVAEPARVTFNVDFRLEDPLPPPPETPKSKP